MTHTIHSVRTFHEAFGHPAPSKPTVSDRSIRELRVKLIAEELGELCLALGVSLHLHVDVQKSDEIYFKVVAITPDEKVDLVEAADALADLDYVVQGSNLVFGLPAEALAAEVHRSNMSKLGADGLPIRREDGKIMKGPNYSPPDLAPIIAAAGR